MEKKFPINVILDNVRSALNVGAIFRTCDATAVEKLYLCGITPYPPHNKIPKTALGSIETVPWERSVETVEVIEKLKKAGNKIISVELTSDAVDYTEFNYEFPIALVFGHEISGVEEDVLKLSDGAIKVPMYGTKESLNVATTVGIVLYEVIRQLNK